MAVTVTLMETSAILGLSTQEAARHFPVATVIVEEYARGSTIPVEIENEAVVRLTGFLHSTATSHGGIRSQKVDDLEVSYFSNHKAALRNSGAEMLLSRFKQRRAV